VSSPGVLESESESLECASALKSQEHHLCKTVVAVGRFSLSKLDWKLNS